jgi:eukaryotic-like serine/threonine-protein kinase
MSSPVVPGTRIDRYRVEGVVGAGSMGDVFRGIDIDLGRKVAIKILSDRHRDNQELRARFVREARAVARISHPNVVQVFTTGTYDDRPFIAMEFLDGVDLGTAIEQNGRLSSLDAAKAIRESALGLQAAQAAGLIHRDVKPSNLVLQRDGTVKVTDFGLAKPLDPSEEPALTALGVVVGTPDYIAPEQARGDPIDQRVDIYALGGTLYYLLTGRPPFRTGNPAEDKYLKVVARHLRVPAPDARAANPAADPELAELARTTMSKSRDERPDYAELIARLDRIIRRLEDISGPVPRAVPPSIEGSSGLIAPTPFVGRGGLDSVAVHRAASEPAIPPGAPDDDDGAPTNLRIPSRPPVAEQRSPYAAAGNGEGPGPGGGRLTGGAGPEPRWTGRDPDTGSGASSSAVMAHPKVAGWLVAVTVLAALIFLVGLGLLLFGPMPAGQAAAMPPDAGPAPIADAAAPPPEPPAGMILVTDRTGAPLVFVDARPVNHDEYAALFPKHKTPRNAGDRPVTGVSLGDARAYADARGKRLATAAELERAAAIEGFVAADGLTEWIAPPASTGDAEARPQSYAPGAEPVARKDQGYKDVTFRLAQSLP